MSAPRTKSWYIHFVTSPTLVIVRILMGFLLVYSCFRADVWLGVFALILVTHDILLWINSIIRGIKLYRGTL